MIQNGLTLNLLGAGTTTNPVSLPKSSISESGVILISRRFWCCSGPACARWEKSLQQPPRFASVCCSTAAAYGVNEVAGWVEEITDAWA